MVKSKTHPTKLPKLESMDHLRILLEILNGQPDRYVPANEIRTEFIKKLNLKKKLDDVALTNNLTNTLSYAEGLRDDLPPAIEGGSPDPLLPHTTAFLAAIAQIRQTKLIDRMRLPLKVGDKTKEEDCYMITIRGIEVLNQLRISRHSKDILTSSRRLELLTLALIALTGYMIVYSISSIMIDCKEVATCYTYPLEVGFGTVITIAILIVIVLFLYSKLKVKWNTS